MRLRLEFSDKYRLWSELVKANTDRLFIEAPTSLVKLGTRVPLELVMGGSMLVATAEVVGQRSDGGRFKPGVWVKLADDEVLKVRRFLGLADEPLRVSAGRTSHRESCSLPMTLKTPALPHGARVRNLSETGALIETTAPLKPGQFIEFDLTLDDGTVVALAAEVIREPDESCTGVRFVEPAAQLGALRAQLERLVARPPNQRQHVLVADDEAEIREFLSRALSKHGYEVLKASAGKEAMALIRESRPSLVLLDILMPGMDGVDICKSMRADVELADIPVIFASAVDRSRLHDIADEAGATDYLTKPLSIGDLFNMVGRYLKK
jgi:CheY-like chemotaxis protein